MNTIFTDFINNYGMDILYTIVMAVVGYVGIVLKNLYQKYVNDATKKAVVNTCVQAVEQIYTDLHGQDKFNKVVESASEMLNEKGITITDIELKMLIEAAVGEFNKVFEGKSVTTENVSGSRWYTQF